MPLPLGTKIGGALGQFLNPSQGHLRFRSGSSSYASRVIQYALDACLNWSSHSGNYRIYVRLLSEKPISPMAGAGDYFRGRNIEAFLLRFDGESHDNKIVNRKLSLWPVIQQLNN